MAHRWKKNVAIIWHKIMMICHCYVPYQLNYGLIYKMSKNNTTQFSFISFWRLRDWTTPSWHWQSKFGMRPSYWYQFHFSWLFVEFQNFLTHMKIYWLFPDFLRFSLFPDFFLTCGNPVNRYFQIAAIYDSYWLNSFAVYTNDNINYDVGNSNNDDMNRKHPLLQGICQQ